MYVGSLLKEMTTTKVNAKRAKQFEKQFVLNDIHSQGKITVVKMYPSAGKKEGTKVSEKKKEQNREIFKFVNVGRNLEFVKVVTMGMKENIAFKNREKRGNAQEMPGNCYERICRDDCITGR